MMGAEQPEQLNEFPPIDEAEWRDQVQKDLEGGRLERLSTPTRNGFDLKPLYGPSDPPPAPSVAFERPDGGRWRIRQGYDHPDPERVAADLASDKTLGAEAAWIRFDRRVRLGLDGRASDIAPGASDGVRCATPQDVERVVSQLDLTEADLFMDAGANALPLFGFLVASARARQVELRSLRGSLMFDPVAAWLRDGSLPLSMQRAAQLQAALSVWCREHCPELRAVAVSSAPLADAGASHAQQIGASLATGRAYLGHLLDGGLSLGDACRQLCFVAAVHGDFFLEIAKLRALRLTWAKLVGACGGGSEAQTMLLHADSARGSKTARDPWVNMLRSTTEGLAAALGGADSISLRPFDEPLGQPGRFARRIATNTHLVLSEEAHADKVADPTAGSFYIDTVTDQLARAGWQRFREIEAQGGIARALGSGWLADRVREVAERQAAAVASRHEPITGVSEFAHLEERLPEPGRVDEEALSRARDKALADHLQRWPQEAARSAFDAAGEPVEAVLRAVERGATLADLTEALRGSGAAERGEPLDTRRRAEPFERLRRASDRYRQQHGARPRAFLCNLGPIPEHGARANFAANLLSAGGIEPLTNDGFASPEDAAKAFAAAGAPFAVICATDEAYTKAVPVLGPLLRERAPEAIVLAGKPRDREASYRQAGVDTFIFQGCDALGILRGLWNRLGVEP